MVIMAAFLLCVGGGAAQQHDTGFASTCDMSTLFARVSSLTSECCTMGYASVSKATRGRPVMFSIRAKVLTAWGMGNVLLGVANVMEAILGVVVKSLTRASVSIVGAKDNVLKAVACAKKGTPAHHAPTTHHVMLHTKTRLCRHIVRLPVLWRVLWRDRLCRWAHKHC
eukprot:SAG31_NODE_1338_length_8731_cov_14.189643_2_plen_168_part_00